MHYETIYNVQNEGIRTMLVWLSIVIPTTCLATSLNFLIALVAVSVTTSRFRSPMSPLVVFTPIVARSCVNYHSISKLTGFS